MSAFGDFGAFFKANKYSVYVLVLLMMCYLINQWNTYSLIATNISMAQEIEYGDRDCDVREENATALEDYLRSVNINVTASDYCGANERLCDDDVVSDEDWCYWRYLGTGWEYQLLAGPLYIVMFSISAIPMGLVSELSNINRKVILVICCICWSCMTVLGGFAQQYWQVCLCRTLLGVFSAACVPFSASLISDYYTIEQRGAALGFFNWGIYLGYSLSFVLIIAEKELGWRTVYFIAGVPGIFVGILILLTLREPPRGGKDAAAEQALGEFSSMTTKLKEAAKYFADPALLTLCLGGAIRNGAGIVWAYNVVNFFEEYHPGVDVERWFSWIPLIFGSIGAFGGGILSDKLSASRGTRGRLIVLIGCLLLSAPFQLGLIYFDDPWCFISHMVGYVIGEMWIGVCVAVVLDIVPADLTTSAVAVYFFIIQIIGGNMPLFVTPITEGLNLRAAMAICFPGFYVVGALFFIVTFFLLKKNEATQYEMNAMAEKDTDSFAEKDSISAINSTAKLTPDKV